MKEYNATHNIAGRMRALRKKRAKAHDAAE
jgi:hypothetical protein